MSGAYEFAKAETMGRRPYQEDYCEFILANDHGNAESSMGTVSDTTRLVAVLADGMGGHVGGAVASQTAITAFKANYAVAGDDTPPAQRLYAALLAGNAAIAEKCRQDASLEGMGCTFIGVMFDGASIYWVSVGDSLISLYRDSNITRLNADHSMAPELDRMAERNEITAEQAQSDPMRNALRSALTGNELTLIDYRIEPYVLMPGDWVILASDGIETLSKSDICGVIESVGQEGVQAVANRLISAVEAAGRPRQDNATVMIVRIPDAAHRRE